MDILSNNTASTVSVDNLMETDQVGDNSGRRGNLRERML
jgi:hypothetical protein